MGETSINFGLVRIVANNSQHVGRVQTIIAMHLYLYGEYAQKMVLRQRWVGLIYVSLLLCKLINKIGIVTLLISISFGLPLVAYESEADFHTLVEFVCMYIVTEWLDDCVVALLTGCHIVVSEDHVNYWIAPCKQHYQAHHRPLTFKSSKSRNSSRTSLLAYVAAKQDVRVHAVGFRQRSEAKGDAQSGH